MTSGSATATGSGGKRHAHATQILVVLALTNLVAYAARNALFVVVPTLKQRFGIDDAEVGLLQTVYMLPHAAATLPFGWAGDRYDRRRVIIVGMVLASFAGAAGALGHSYVGLSISRGLVGLGTAAVVPVANSILSEIFEGPHKASRLSIFNLGLFLGGVAGFAVGIAVGFPLVVIVLAVPAFALAAVLAGLDVPRHRTPPPDVVWYRYLAQVASHFLSEVYVLVRIRTLRWIIASATAMSFAGGGYTAWLKELLTREKHLSEKQASTLLALSLFGGLGGILTGGRVADMLRRKSISGRLWTSVIGMLCTIPCAALAIELPNSAALYVAGIATLYFFSWYHAPIAASVDDLAPPARSVAAQGLVIFTMHMVGTAPSSWVVGEVSQHTSLKIAMWVPTVALGVGAACMAIATTGFAADHKRARAGDRA
ncbi:MAG TPA: MFS transporter [Kofleriaceae bacterium]|nr:MFS transporter [Kofleriaceae bacterium]